MVTYINFRMHTVHRLGAIGTKAMLLCELFSSLSTDTFIAMATSVRENLVTRHMRLSTDVGEEFGDGEVGCLGYGRGVGENSRLI